MKDPFIIIFLVLFPKHLLGHFPRIYEHAHVCLNASTGMDGCLNLTHAETTAALHMLWVALCPRLPTSSLLFLPIAPLPSSLSQACLFSMGLSFAPPFSLIFFLLASRWFSNITHLSWPLFWSCCIMWSLNGSLFFFSLVNVHCLGFHCVLSFLLYLPHHTASVWVHYAPLVSLSQMGWSHSCFQDGWVYTGG